MKDVTIISKVVGRKEGDRPVTGGGSQVAVDLSAYLLKKTWDTAWELREKDGVPYLFGKLPVVLQSGMTSYVADEAVDLPGIYDGLPIDNQTLYWEELKEEVGTDEEGNPIYETTKVLKAKGGGGGVADSVHWDNIEGKPNFDDYATQEALKDYLPLSGGTMTGQINMPVGIGNAIKFGEESRLFASNGIFYISAETHLVFASGASGNNVPNNVVINKDGRMFIANNLAVGRSSFITDSYKLNVAGDAFIGGMLAVGGNINPGIPSLYNIGDSTKRFLNVFTDKVNVGGIEIRLLQDGVLLIDGNLAVKGGITSYVDGGDLDLPSIYDGLPIDNQTLYWEELKEEVGTDEEGNPIYETTKVLKAKGGGGGVADSVHWDNIEGKPNFDDYATQEALKDYLPLSGGTMTGQINMPVGIGNAIKFGEESRLFAYNGNLYISAEANLVLASGASGNTVPNNAVIDKTGRMFIANNLAVGRSSFITDSYKLNVAGDAFIGGMLAVGGNINPGIPSLYNIGDSTKRFLNVFTDKVNVGGIEIRLLQDGVLLIDGNLAVKGGITSYVDGGDLDLPSIYDGLPIDGDTLYWVLDENGKKVMLKSKGDNNEGGGSVKFPLSWSGFSNGSWDGSEAKTIQIPSKLSDLENDGQFFADGGWIGSLADSVTFGSYLYGGIEGANTPSSSGQLLAFNNGNLASWDRGSQIFIEGENFYYRQFWDNYWRNWRKVISGDSNGVIDYDLTLGGSLNMPSSLAKIKSGDKSIIESYNEGGDTYIIGENSVYLESKGLYTLQNRAAYKILHEGNYRDYEYTAKRLSVTDIRNTTPKPSDVETFSVTAQFANTDNPGDGWYSGLSIQGWTNDYKAWQLRSGAGDFASDHLYFRNGVLETWNDWRRVITGDVNGVIDYDLTLGGSLNMPFGLAKIKSGEKSIVESYNEGGDTYIIGENSLYLTTKALFTIKDGSVYGILHEGNYTDYEYTAKRLSVTDIRNTTPKPSDLETFSVTAQFANTDNPGAGWYSGLSIQGWTNDYKAWQLRSGAMDFASDHLYFRNGVLETWNDWRRVITGDVDGVLDSNLEVKGEEGGNIKFVVNPSGCIENGIYELTSIRHALRFPWYDEAYEIGTIRSNSAGAWGFGVTYQNNQLVWRVDRERMDVYGDLRVKNGLIRYNEEEGYFYIDGNLVVSGGVTAFADEGAGNQWILDATSLSSVTSTNQYKVYSARVTKLIKDEVDEINDKIAAIKTAFNGLSSSSSAAAIVSALKTLANKL